MKLKNLLFILTTSILFASCSDGRFDRLPGIYQDMIPTEIQGNYLLTTNDFKSKKLDSLKIQITPNEIRFLSPGNMETWNIHQHFQMNKLNELLVLGRNDETFKTLWNLTIIEPVPNGLRIYFVKDYKAQSSPETILQRYMPFVDMPLKHEPIANAPSIDGTVVAPTEVGNGAEMLRYYTMNEDQFKTYFERELKDKEFYLLKKEVVKEAVKKAKK